MKVVVSTSTKPVSVKKPKYPRNFPMGTLVKPFYKNSGWQNTVGIVTFERGRGFQTSYIQHLNGGWDGPDTICEELPVGTIVTAEVTE